MVRNITGTLLDVAQKKLKKEEIPLIIASKDRKKAGRSAPARGLFLIEIRYDESIRSAPLPLPSPFQEVGGASDE